MHLPNWLYELLLLLLHRLLFVLFFTLSLSLLDVHALFFTHQTCSISTLLLFLFFSLAHSNTLFFFSLSSRAFFSLDFSEFFSVCRFNGVPTLSPLFSLFSRARFLTPVTWLSAWRDAWSSLFVRKQKKESFSLNLPFSTWRTKRLTSSSLCSLYVMLLLCRLCRRTAWVCRRDFYLIVWEMFWCFCSSLFLKVLIKKREKAWKIARQR